jgi:hypothetical protein
LGRNDAKLARWEMGMDKVQELLTEALRQGAANPGEQRLYRAGKLPGLFAARTSVHAEAASLGVREGLVEIVRTETKGKAVIEWVRVTPKGVQFVLDRDSPVRAMNELQALLTLNAEGLPGWVEQLQTQLDELSRQFLGEVQGLRQRLEHMIERVQQALRRTDKYGVTPEAGAAGGVPWSGHAVDYLERRREGGIGEKCPLPELFGQIRRVDEQLTIHDFHHGLRRLHDRGALRLWPHEGGDGPPEPEYALLDGPMVYWYAAR